MKYEAREDVRFDFRLRVKSFISISFVIVVVICALVIAYCFRSFTLFLGITISGVVLDLLGSIKASKYTTCPGCRRLIRFKLVEDRTDRMLTYCCDECETIWRTQLYFECDCESTQ